MIAECDDKETVLMWSTANELLRIPNNQDKQNRLDEFKRRFNEVRPQPTSVVSVNHARKNRRTNSSLRRTTSTKQVPSRSIDIRLSHSVSLPDHLFSIDDLRRATHRRIYPSSVRVFLCRGEASRRRHLQKDCLHKQPRKP